VKFPKNSSDTYVARRYLPYGASSTNSSTMNQFFANGTSLGADTTSPYTSTFTPTVAGTYSLTAVATDDLGLTTTSSTISVTVTGGNAPSVAISSPANASLLAVGTANTVTATATPVTGTIASVQFFANGVSLGTDTTFPYSATWSPVANGSYSLTALAIDTAGNQATSSAVTVTVAANVAPSVAIGSPANVSNPAEIFRFTMTMPNQPGFVHVRIPWEQVRTGAVSVYLSPIDSPTSQLARVGTDGAWVNVGGNPCAGQQVTTPPSRRVFAGETVVLSTSGDGPTWQWFKNNVELHESEFARGAESATLTLPNIRPQDSGDYVLFTLCSHTDIVRVDAFCRSDFNNDGFTDFFDYEAYVECFETDTCPQTLPARSADFNNDGFADFFDYDAFVQAFETGAC
jgi:hypothetical protein